MAGDTEGQDSSLPANPLDSESTLIPPPPEPLREEAHPPQAPLEEDSSVTKAEKFERHGLGARELAGEDHVQSPAKRIKLDGVQAGPATASNSDSYERQKGTAPIKAE